MSAMLAFPMDVDPSPQLNTTSSIAMVTVALIPPVDTVALASVAAAASASSASTAGMAAASASLPVPERGRDADVGMEQVAAGGLWVVGHYDTLSHTWRSAKYNLNVGANSDVDKSYDALPIPERISMAVAEFMQNVMDWATGFLHARCLRRGETPPRLGIFSFIDAEQGLFSESRVRKIVQVHGDYCFAALDLLTEDGADGSAQPTPLIEVVLDIKSQTFYMLQVGQGAVDVKRMLTIFNSSKEATTTDIDAFVPLAGRHGLGFKQIMLLCLKPTYEWSYEMRGTVEVIGGPNDQPTPAIACMRPVASESQSIACIEGNVELHGSIFADVVARNRFRKTTQQLVGPDGKRLPMLLQKLSFAHVSSAIATVEVLQRSFCFSHILFRSPMHLARHVVCGTRDIDRLRMESHDPRRYTFGGNGRSVDWEQLATEQTLRQAQEDSAFLDFSSLYPPWRSMDSTMLLTRPLPICFKGSTSSPPPSSSAAAAATAAAAVASCSSTHGFEVVQMADGPQLRQGCSYPPLKPFQFATAARFVNGIPLVLCPTRERAIVERKHDNDDERDVDGASAGAAAASYTTERRSIQPHVDELIVCVDIRKYSRTQRGAEHLSDGFGLSKLFDAALNSRMGREDGEIGKRWCLEVIASALVQPTTLWAQTLLQYRHWRLADLTVSALFGHLSNVFDHDDFNALYEQLSRLGIPFPKQMDSQVVKQHLGPFGSWLLGTFSVEEEDDHSGESNYVERVVKLPFKTTDAFIKRAVLDGLVKKDCMPRMLGDLSSISPPPTFPSSSSASGSSQLVDDDVDARCQGVLRLLCKLASFVNAYGVWLCLENDIKDMLRHESVFVYVVRGVLPTDVATEGYRSPHPRFLDSFDDDLEIRRQSTVAFSLKSLPPPSPTTSSTAQSTNASTAGVCATASATAVAAAATATASTTASTRRVCGRKRSHRVAVTNNSKADKVDVVDLMDDVDVRIVEQNHRLREEELQREKDLDARFGFDTKPLALPFQILRGRASEPPYHPIYRRGLNAIVLYEQLRLDVARSSYHSTDDLIDYTIRHMLGMVRIPRSVMDVLVPLMVNQLANGEPFTCKMRLIRILQQLSSCNKFTGTLDQL